MSAQLRIILRSILDLLEETRDKAAPMSDEMFYAELDKLRGMIKEEEL